MLLCNDFSRTYPYSLLVLSNIHILINLTLLITVSTGPPIILIHFPAFLLSTFRRGVLSFLQRCTPDLGGYHSHHAVPVSGWPAGRVRLPAVQKLDVSQRLNTLTVYLSLSLSATLKGSHCVCST